MHANSLQNTPSVVSNLKSLSTILQWKSELYFACTTIVSSREPKETAHKHTLTRQKKPNNLSVRACAYVCRYPTIEAHA
jgi:hypothetical protein